MNIKIRNLSKAFGEKQVLQNLSLEFASGKCHVIMGPSGCGKTTLLRILMGFEKQDAGTIEGLPVHKSAVFQEDRLCEDFSAVENVAMVLKKGFPRSEIAENLRAIGLDGDLNQPVSEYSGGMKRRVAIVRAVLAEADLIFLDEPFKGLDTDTRDLALQYFLSHTKGKTSIVVTHDEKEARMLAAAEHITHL
ncbi:MAG: ATP-binding cassette domain-containing protein [Clostridiales bacterium]|nr:ATP-binding cassette domain-containing protein [Candidatus Blautia equi]